MKTHQFVATWPAKVYGRIKESMFAEGYPQGQDRRSSDNAINSRICRRTEILLRTSAWFQAKGIAQGNLKISLKSTALNSY